MFWKYLVKSILRNFTKKVTNLVLSFCFVSRLFNLTKSNKKQTPLDLSCLTDMSVVNSSSYSKKELRTLLCRVIREIFHKIAVFLLRISDIPFKRVSTLFYSNLFRSETKLHFFTIIWINTCYRKITQLF